MNIHKTLIAVPTMGELRVELVQWLFEVKKERGESVEIYFTNRMAPHSVARNHIVNHFLGLGEEYTMLLMIDSDTIPPKEGLERLMQAIESGVDEEGWGGEREEWSVATGITPIARGWGGKVSGNVYRVHSEVETGVLVDGYGNDLFECVGCGASFLLIRRSVLVRIKEGWRSRNGEGLWFKSIEFDNGRMCSEDLYFCEQVTGVGGKIVCDPTAVCKHAKVVLL